MAAEVRMDYPTVIAAAAAQDDAQQQVTEIEGIRAGAVLEQQVLGKILPAEEIVSGYEQASAETAASLQTLTECFDTIREGLDYARESQMATDDAANTAFTGLQGGIR